MDDMLSKISGILENPEALEKIKSIAGSLGVSEQTATPSREPLTEPEASPQAGANGQQSGGQNDLLSGLAALNLKFDGERTVTLLEAIRPFLRESRLPKLNTAIKAVQMLGVLSKLK